MVSIRDKLLEKWLFFCIVMLFVHSIANFDVFEAIHRFDCSSIWFDCGDSLPRAVVAILFFYIIVHGIAQHKGKHTGTTAAPDLLPLFDFFSASYSYFPLPLA